jgi:hypothetical protein
MALTADDEVFVADVADEYRHLLVGNGARIDRGGALWDQFEEIVALYAAAAVPDSTLVEKVNEMAVARELAMDPHLSRAIAYEPAILPSGRKIDFVAERKDDAVYIEVKTVRPQSGDEAKNWEVYQVRSRHHPANVHFIVGGDFPGTLYTNPYRSRAKFLDYALEFEQRLAEAKSLRMGPGVLVICGTGFQWTVDQLEDFADFYLDRAHRTDDAFAPMEAHHILERRIHLAHNIDQFAYLKRPAHVPRRTEFRSWVRGPYWGRGVGAARPADGLSRRLKQQSP